jgi:hypothetical protein
MRWIRRAGVLLLLPLVASCASLQRDPNWWSARRDSSGQAPDPATTSEAVLQVYAARTVGWKGLLGVHTWVALKPSGASEYTRYEVIGWGVNRGAPAVRVNRTGPDNYWVDPAGNGADRERTRSGTNPA